MSTAISTAQTATLVTAAILKTDEKPAKLVRTSSIEKFLKFNTYICSPQYYTLPAILTWLRSSKNGFHASAEKTIFLFRSLIFSSFLFRYSSHGVRSALQAGRRVLISQLPSTLLGVAFHVGVVLLASQLLCCAYLLATVVVPLGLSFLLSSIVGIVLLGYKINRFSCRKCDRRKKTK
ncbi:uncharacterized protein LOC132705835 [Cylas formicarius]|uniref:uncharacterized protein LOC132705835 n=1 Tax=Cylas formicarius TaxID=197179 RepID=UPI0029584CFB|nr:uncharacterized protein LOC132705835 [Cylas formicarius]XP_060532733.1 uncharacterized protein LOC132705835 [Cylas formicarius]